MGVWEEVEPMQNEEDGGRQITVDSDVMRSPRNTFGESFRPHSTHLDNVKSPRYEHKILYFSSRTVASL